MGDERKVRMEDAPDGVVPKCPGCAMDLDVVWLSKQGLGFREQKQVAMCPHCRVMLGYGTAKLFH